MVAWSPYLASFMEGRPSGLKRVRNRLWFSQMRKCVFCGRSCRQNTEQKSRRSDDLFTLDHVIPRSRGGSDGPENLVGSCSRCNVRRDAVEKTLFSGRVLTDKQMASPELFPVVREDELPYLMRMLERE